jgi:8-oxo-dGTP diphosphatase
MNPESSQPEFAVAHAPARPDYRRTMPQREFPLSPLVGVGGIVVHQNRVLLVQRGTEPLKGQWTIPGGLIDIGETLREAVIREVREETGLSVEPLELVELLDRIHREDGRVRYHYVIADYLCRMDGGTLQAASDAAAVRWVERSEWNSHSALRIDPITTRVIEAAWQRARVMQAQSGESL